MGKATRRDRYLILDLELTCWEHGIPDGMQPDIISIGIVDIDTKRREIVREGEFLVRPVRSTLSAYCTALTGITAEDIRKRGRPFPEVGASLKKHFGIGKKVWMAWGNDRDAITEACNQHQMEMPFSTDYINLSAVLGLGLGHTKRLGLSHALQLAGMEFEGREHSALSDARNTARLWLTVSGAIQASLGGPLQTETSS